MLNKLKICCLKSNYRSLCWSFSVEDRFAFNLIVPPPHPVRWHLSKPTQQYFAHNVFEFCPGKQFHHRPPPPSSNPGSYSVLFKQPGSTGSKRLNLDHNHPVFPPNCFYNHPYGSSTPSSILKPRNVFFSTNIILLSLSMIIHTVVFKMEEA